MAYVIDPGMRCIRRHNYLVRRPMKQVAAQTLIAALEHRRLQCDATVAGSVCIT